MNLYDNLDQEILRKLRMGVGEVYTLYSRDNMTENKEFCVKLDPLGVMTYQAVI